MNSIVAPLSDQPRLAAESEALANKIARILFVDEDHNPAVIFTALSDLCAFFIISNHTGGGRDRALAVLTETIKGCLAIREGKHPQ